MTLNDILSRLEGVKGRDGKYMARCPNHGDSTPSLSVSLGEDNKILLKCFAGCSTEDIVWSMDLQMKDLFAEITPATAFPVYEEPQRKQSTTEKTKMEAEYLYAGGQLKKVKYRRPDGSKYCAWLHKEADGSWAKGRNNIAPGLYCCHQLDNAESLFIVEGEKDVENMAKAGMVAVSLPDGSQSKWESAYEKILAGKKIAILPDNDAPGMKHAQMCAEKLYGVAAELWVLDLKQAWPEILEKGDVSDLIDRFGADAAMQKVVQLLQSTPQWEPPAAEEDPFLSLFKPLAEFEEEEATWLIPGWVPEGQITLIAADGGVGKTTLWSNIIAALSSGTRCILDPVDHVREPMKIAFCSTEDSVKKKLRKKLREAGANMDNIITVDLSADKDGALRDFKFGSTKMDRFVRYYKPIACAFDPVQGFLPPKVNMGSRNEMRDCMAPLIVLGEDVGTTFLVICHTNKRKGAYGRDRIADSADLWDIARSVIMAGYTESQGIRYLSNEKNNYTQLQETILFSIDETGQIQREGTSWKRDKEYMLDATVAKSAPKRDDCKEFILNALQDAPNQCMKSDELVKKAQEYSYSYKTIKSSREELVNDGTIENYYTGIKGKKGRICFVRIKQEVSQQFKELPYEEPVPFDQAVESSLEVDGLLPL